MTAINVNIGARHTTCSGAIHASKECEPINIPCRLPPSFTCEVALGECDCGGVESMSGRGGIGHEAQCPARPIRVSASITSPDGSWEKSEVKDAMRVGAMGREYHIPTDDLLQSACRDRWEIVKALVLGKESAAQINALGLALCKQRDAVYAALADMARTEDALLTAQYHADEVLKPRGLDADHRSWADNRPSTARLAAYVAHLIEQVGVMT